MNETEPTATPAASHDSATPPALVSFMLRRWRTPNARPVRPLANAPSFAARRRALSAQYPGEVLVIPTGHEKVRANDTMYRFRPGTDFFYLTGNVEPDCVLVMLPEGGGHLDVLYVEPNPGRSDPTFFTDRKKGELWVGARLGVDGSAHRYGLTARPLPDLPGFLAALSLPVRVLRGVSALVDAAVPGSQHREDAFAAALSEARLRKSAEEVRQLSAVIASTKRGFDDVIRVLRTARSEREVEGIFNLRARVEGNDVGYGTIAASGKHACTLHWTRNDGRLDQGDLLLLDAGVEGNSLYTADITRTLPMSGRFSPEQREIYHLVWQAQRAAFAEVKPGNDFMAPNAAAMAVMARGLVRLGILKDAEEALYPWNQFYKRYTLHNVSHMLGLDVHDCAKAREEAYKFGKLTPGMVLTVEPGLYFQPDDLTVPTRYRGIGVRIEDDVLVTPTGMRNLSKQFPSRWDAVERWMAAIQGAQASA